ncbi:MAG TPA: hypothetical protein VNK23_07035 [Candidatus Dormibacteraeota bacterium]|nr:hypothetical protein [Candidatus Dormibacteraeota bacterium]
MNAMRRCGLSVLLNLVYVVIAAAVFATAVSMCAAPSRAATSKSAKREASQAASDKLCGRACLDGFVDNYLAAVVAHKPTDVAFAPNVKFTEQTAALKIGQGTWGTFNGIGNFKLHFDDVARGEAGYIGTMKEWGYPVIFCLRLKVTGGQIAEVEDFVVRDEDAAKKLDAMQPNPLFTEDVPPAQRESRAELVKIANMYFSGLQQDTGKGDYPFAPDCNRIENATQTTNNPQAAASQVYNPGLAVMKLGCKAQFETGYFKVVTKISDRRFVIVDPERGLAFAFAFFNHAGRLKTITLTNGETFPATLRHPYTFEIGELFKIEKGKIRQIQAVLTEEPYGIRSGWGPAGLQPPIPKPLPPEADAASKCDGKCLDEMTDRFRAALIAHDPSLLPVTSNVRYTENGQVLKIGDGLWGTLTGWGSYKLYIDDPEDGEAGFVGETFEAGMPGLLCARLRVVDGKVSQIEVLDTRKETPTGFTQPEGLTNPKVAPKLASFYEEIPESERESKQDLIAQTDLYFDGIEKSNGNIVPWAPGVIRVENGTQTCPSSFGQAAKNGPLSCSKQLDTHLFEYIFPISPRRYTVVDRAHGIVMGTFMFNTPGTVEYVNVPSVGKVRESRAALRPFSEEVDEIFKIKDGKIEAIIAVMTGLPFGDTPGWTESLR